MAAGTIVLVPEDERRPLSEFAVGGPLGRDVVSFIRSLSASSRGHTGGGVSVDASLLVRPGSSSARGDGREAGISSGAAKRRGDLSDDSDGLLAYSVSTVEIERLSRRRPNVRATRLAMACGHHGTRLHGDVWLARLGGKGMGAPPTLLQNVGLSAGDVGDACRLSPDLRDCVLVRLRWQDDCERTAVDSCGHEVRASPSKLDDDDRAARRWLGDAAMRAYRDGGSIAALARAMSRAEEPGGTSSEDEDEEDDDGPSSDSSSSESDEDGDEAAASTAASASLLVNRTLCIHCRGPAEKTDLCGGCGGVYLHPRCA